MSREVRRVPLDFGWPLRKVWDGYLMPDLLSGNECPGCENGYSPEAKHLFDLWYGHVPFDPESTGSTPLQHNTPAVRAFAERNVSNAPDYYGTTEWDVVREAQRLADLWNGAWCHHLEQADVDALVAADRLWDLTRTLGTDGWKTIEPPVTPTAAQVNEWSLRGFGHDSLNASVVVRSRCERDGVAVECSHCEGHGSLEAYPGQRAEAEAWEPTEPPAGDGWQLWESVSEGSPVTPVFATSEELIRHLCAAEGFRESAARTLVEQGGTLGTLVGTSHGLLRSDMDADIIAGLGDA